MISAVIVSLHYHQNSAVVLGFLFFFPLPHGGEGGWCQETSTACFLKEKKKKKTSKVVQNITLLTLSKMNLVEKQSGWSCFTLVRSRFNRMAWLWLWPHSAKAGVPSTGCEITQTLKLLHSVALAALVIMVEQLWLIFLWGGWGGLPGSFCGSWRV